MGYFCLNVGQTKGELVKQKPVFVQTWEKKKKSDNYLSYREQLHHIYRLCNFALWFSLQVRTLRIKKNDRHKN